MAMHGDAHVHVELSCARQGAERLFTLASPHLRLLALQDPLQLVDPGLATHGLDGCGRTESLEPLCDSPPSPYPPPSLPSPPSG